MAGVKAKTHGSEKRRTAGHPPVGFVGYLEKLERRLAVVVPSKTKTRGAGAPGLDGRVRAHPLPKIYRRARQRAGIKIGGRMG